MSVSFANSARAQESLNFVLEWTHALTGSNPISGVLDQLLQLVHAEAGVVVRASKSSEKISYIARCCAQKGKAFPTQPQTHAKNVLGSWFETAKAGSVWKSSEIRHDGRSAFWAVRSKPVGIDEVIVVPLEANADHLDLLELHFSKKPRDYELDLLGMLASTLANGWSRRVPGAISSQCKQGRGNHLRAVKSDIHIPILDPRNPAELSRSEFRICAMMKEGMTAKNISQTLSVCQTTVRSHLSSIFAKTGVSNQVELLHLLNRKAEAQSNFDSIAVARSG